MTPTKQKTKKPPVLWLVVAGVVVLAAVIAVVASSGGNGDKGGDKSTEHLEQTRPVEITETAVPVLGDDAGTDPAIGTTIPTVKGASFDGTPVTISPGDGHPKLLLFAAHWCPHCRREIPLLSDHLAENPLPKGVDLVVVATGTNAQAPNYPPSDWLADNPLPGKVLADSADSRTAAAFGLPGYPYFVAVDADGKIVGRTSGEISTDQFDQLVQQATGTT